MPYAKLLHYLLRTYDPALGRWWQQDPVQDAMPGLSSYHQTYGNPVNYHDPLGLYGYGGGLNRHIGESAGEQWMREHGMGEGYTNPVFQNSRPNPFMSSLNSFVAGLPSGSRTMLQPGADGQFDYYLFWQGKAYYSNHENLAGTLYLLDQGQVGFGGGTRVGLGDPNRFTTDRLFSLNAEDLYGGLGIGVGVTGTYFGVKGNVTHNSLYWRQKNGTLRLRTAATKSNYLFNRSYNLVGKSLQGVKALGTAFGIAGLALTANDIVFGAGFTTSNVLDAAFGAAGFIPGVGWAISGAYFITNTAVTLYSGKTIGVHLEESLGY